MGEDNKTVMDKHRADDSFLYLHVLPVKHKWTASSKAMALKKLLYFLLAFWLI